MESVYFNRNRLSSPFFEESIIKIYKNKEGIFALFRTIENVGGVVLYVFREEGGEK